MSAKVNGHTLDAKCSGITPVATAKVNGKQSQPTNTKSKLSEETVRETFGHLGMVERVVLPAKPGKHARHAYISE